MWSAWRSFSGGRILPATGWIFRSKKDFLFKVAACYFKGLPLQRGWRRFMGTSVCFNGGGSRRFNGAPRRCLRMAAARKIVCRRSRSGALLPEKEPNVAESRSVTLVQGRYRLCRGRGSGSGIGGSEESAEKARKNYKKNSKMSVKTLEKTVKLC